LVLDVPFDEAQPHNADVAVIFRMDGWRTHDWNDQQQDWKETAALAHGYPPDTNSCLLDTTP
jgi:hypothetical protein